MKRHLFNLVRTLLLTFVLASLNSISFAQQRATEASQPTPVQLLQKSKTTIFLGDSITAAGQYIGFVEAWIATQKWEHQPKIIDLGLPSETVSGLSEEGHAGGQFPRPDLAERLDRVLALTKPDLVFACYGINCGIYEPFDQQRFEQFQQGYRRLKKNVEAAGAQLVVITPPFYDDFRKPLKGFSYNEVLDKYSQWLVEQREHGWLVIDIHSAMTQEILNKRKTDPAYTVQPDGVHPDAAGHWCVARHLIKGLGGEFDSESTPEKLFTEAGLSVDSLSLIQKRVALLRDAYVAAAGHKRPGVAAGLPLPEAEKQAAEILAKLNGK